MTLKLPNTRYSGSKRKLVSRIWKELGSLELEFNSVLDIFGGTGSFAYYAKLEGKQVFYNDIFKFNFYIGKALIINTCVDLTYEELHNLLISQEGRLYKNVVEKNYQGIYYTDEENRQIDIIVQNIEHLNSESKRASAYYILFQSCLIKRPYNLFHRKNLNLRTNYNGGSFGNKVTWEKSFAQLFEKFYVELTEFCFDNLQANFASNESALDCTFRADLVYIDPPYFSSTTHVSYHSKYHFLEGLANYNILQDNISITKNNKEVIINRRNEFETKQNFLNDLLNLVLNYNQSIIVISYRSNGFPSIPDIVAVIEQVKATVKVINLGKYNYALNRSNNSNSECLIVGY